MIYHEESNVYLKKTSGKTINPMLSVLYITLLVEKDIKISLLLLKHV